jgi:hypothetical protein
LLFNLACNGPPEHCHKSAGHSPTALEEPERFAVLDKEARRIIGGSWDYWWLKTPLLGIVWCNCPHMTGLDGLKVEDLTAAEFEGRRRIHAMVDYAQANLPGFARCYIVDIAPQTGVRQTRLLDGEYVVTKEDIAGRIQFPDSIARGRDYYTPYRALLPRAVDRLLVAGRHYSATPPAQKISREISPCMAMGEAAGIAAVMALDTGVPVRAVDVAALQRKLRVQGADPGDEGQPSPLKGEGREGVTAPQPELRPGPAGRHHPHPNPPPSRGRAQVTP